MKFPIHETVMQTSCFVYVNITFPANHETLRIAQGNTKFPNHETVMQTSCFMYISIHFLPVMKPSELFRQNQISYP